jgi:hypothetical protein
VGQPSRNSDLPEEALWLIRLAGAGSKHLDGHFAPVLEVFGQVDRCHASATDLFLDAVAIRDGGLQAFWHGGHVWHSG